MTAAHLDRGMLLSELGWRDRLKYAPAFLGYPVSAFSTVVALVLVATLMEGIGIALVYPIIEIIQSGDTPDALAARSTVFRYTVRIMNFAEVPVTLGNMILATAFFVILRQVLTFTNSILRAYFGMRAVQRISSRTFTLFTGAGLPYTERLRSGTLVNALFTESKRAAMCAQAIQNIIAAVFKIGIYMAVLIFVSWQATIIGVGLLAVAAIMVSRSSVRGTRLSGQMINEANDRLARYVSERFGLFRLMKVSRTERIEADLYREESRRLRSLNVDVARYSAQIQAFTEGTAVLGGLALIYVAVEALDLRLAVLGVFLLVIFRLLPVAQEIAVARQHISAYVASVNYIDRISLEASAAQERDTGSKAFPPLNTGFRFDRVSFRYPAADSGTRSAPALDSVSFQIPAGRTTALLGASGAGKSTVVDIIPRLREPTEGQVLFDDVPASDIRLDDLRRNIAMVSQDALIIDGSVEENLRYGLPDASKEEVRAAAEAAFAHDFIEKLPRGYDTVVGERGVLLSGGQKQRLALARALLAKVPVLLLDEPTSALDAESEQAVQRALETLQKRHDMTIVIIAHRLSTVRHANHLIVLEEGRVLGTGTHDELMATAPWYRKIVELQTGEKVPAPKARATRAKKVRSTTR